VGFPRAFWGVRSRRGCAPGSQPGGQPASQPVSQPASQQAGCQPRQLCSPACVPVCLPTGGPDGVCGASQGFLLRRGVEAGILSPGESLHRPASQAWARAREDGPGTLAGSSKLRTAEKKGADVLFGFFVDRSKRRRSISFYC